MKIQKQWCATVVLGLAVLCQSRFCFCAAPVPAVQELSTIIDKAAGAFRKCSDKTQQCAIQVIEEYFGPSTRAYVALVSARQQSGAVMLQSSFMEQIARVSDKSKWSPWSVMTIDLPGTEVPTGLEIHRMDKKDERWVVPFIYSDKQWKIETIEPHDLVRLKTNQTR